MLKYINLMFTFISLMFFLLFILLINLN